MMSCFRRYAVTSCCQLLPQRYFHYFYSAAAPYFIFEFRRLPPIRRCHDFAAAIFDVDDMLLLPLPQDMPRHDADITPLPFSPLYAADASRFFFCWLRFISMPRRYATISILRFFIFQVAAIADYADYCLPLSHTSHVRSCFSLFITPFCALR